MVNKDFCLSSYMAFRYIWKDGVDFVEGFQHKNFRPVAEEDRIPVRTSEDINLEIQKQFDALYAKYSNIGILLSGGMDSANLAAYLKSGSHAPAVMRHKFAPVHSIEPQIYKAAEMAKNDGVQLMIVGESADLIFGGMDKLISPVWTFDAFVKRYMFLDPKMVLANPVDQLELFERYREGENGIDVLKFMDEVFSIESSSSYLNAFGAAWMPYYDPYAKLVMADPLDMDRVRNGEPKYLVRGLYAIKYPELEIPFKIPMPRPVDAVFKNWSGPTRPEFREDIDMNSLTGNQKWQLWCAESFLEMMK